jgi:CheY-like chemotaxis protein
MKTVLIVEDDAIIARIYQGLLRKDGYQTHVASDGAIANEFLKETRPDLILLDLMLPKKNGVQVLKEIRASAELSTIPVLVFSNGYMGDLMRDALRAGATHCFAKAQTPPRKVVEAIRSYLELSTTQPAIPAEAPRAALPDRMPGNHAQAVRKMRAALKALTKREPQSNGATHLSELGELFAECGSAGPAELEGVAQTARALQALTNELRTQTATLEFSSLRTLAQGVDCLDTLLARAAQGQRTAPKTSMVLVLDGDAASRQLVSSSLERAGLRPFEAHDSKMALQVLFTNSFDLVLLNADMPEVNSIEVCKQVRDSEKNKTTPVVFVTGPTNLEGRASSIMSGAEDVLRKPFSPAELAVKALLYILTPRSKTQFPTVLKLKPQHWSEAGASKVTT